MSCPSDQAYFSSTIVDNNFYRFDAREGCWLPAKKGLDNFTVLSYNVLFELHDPSIVRCGRRWPYLIDFLSESSSDIIALQEVTNSFLQLLLEQNWVRESYYVSDRSIVAGELKEKKILLTKYAPRGSLLGAGASKRFHITQFMMNHRPLLLCNIHLNSNRSDIISACLNMSQTKESDILFVGDTNFSDRDTLNDYPIPLKDQWEHLYPSHHGYTFDSNRNALAKLNSPNHSVRRYDRFILSSRSLAVLSMEIVGTEEVDTTVEARCKWSEHLKEPEVKGEEVKGPLYLSDHYGLKANVYWENNNEEEDDQQTPPSELREWLMSERLIPDNHHIEERRRCTHRLGWLCKAALRLSQESPECVYPIGSSKLDIYNQESDLDALCCGSHSVQHIQFFRSLSEVIPQFEDIRIVHIALNANVPLARLLIGQMQIELSYCNVPQPQGLTEVNLRGLSAASQRSICGLLDAEEMQRRIMHEKVVFCDTVRAIKYWAKRRGILSNGLGFLGGFSWSLLVMHIVDKYKPSTSESAVEMFFSRYANHDWSVSINRSKQKFIRTPSRVSLRCDTREVTTFPYKNTARNVTQSTLELMNVEVKRGDIIFKSDHGGDFMSRWKEIISPIEFYSTYKNYLRVDVSCPTEEGTVQCKGFINSHLVSFLLDMEAIRLFVHPFTTIYSQLAGGEGEGEIQSVFVGISAAQCKEGATVEKAVMKMQSDFEAWPDRPDGSKITVRQLRSNAKTISQLRQEQQDMIDK
ncbi:poly(A) polymerase alpha-like [Planoprotostelium fungivorum]|uniref:polynucleotide adenylyltransferase n=1 Tax=Planoprotostelium fungivorum TaxID=1890364 RepID=A0A2P6NHE3_9EUKA|nr:poly(A) polymerase alpha-like [Planoprotostelium fungivorum]